MLNQLDVVIIHNNQNTPAIIQFSEKLTQYDLHVVSLQFRDEVPQPLPENVIRMARAVTIAIGQDGLGPWDLPPIRTELEGLHQRNTPMSLVMLSTAVNIPEPPPFLAHIPVIKLESVEQNTGWSKLILEIKGLSEIMATGREIVGGAAKAQGKEVANQSLDAVGLAAVKSRLHALSEIVAKDAAEEAARAVKTYPHDLLTTIVPLIVECRWRRGYKAGLERLLNVPEPKQHLGVFHCEAVLPPCAVDQGLLTAEKHGKNEILIRLDNHPAVIVKDLHPAEIELLLNSINNYGRLGRARSGELAVLDRIREIPLMVPVAQGDRMAAALFRNREALIPLIARFRIPGIEWLFPDEENVLQLQADLVRDTNQTETRLRPRSAPQLPSDEQAEEQTYLANQPFAFSLFVGKHGPRTIRS